MTVLKEKFQEKKSSFDQAVALMQRSIDGTFYFSSAASKETVDSISKREISKIKILPSASIGKVSNLGICSAAAVRPVQRRGGSGGGGGGGGIGKKYQNKSYLRNKVPDFLEYGSFSSFAPYVDSSFASLSPADAVALNYPNRRVNEKWIVSY